MTVQEILYVIVNQLMKPEMIWSFFDRKMIQSFLKKAYRPEWR